MDIAFFLLKMNALLVQADPHCRCRSIACL